MFHLFEAMNHETRNTHLMLMNDENAYRRVVRATKDLATRLENARTDNAYKAAKRIYTKQLRQIYSEIEHANIYESELTVWPLIVDLLILKYDQGELA